MAHAYQGNDRDSAYGDDDNLFFPDPMFALPAPLAGSKRDVNNVILTDPKSAGLGLAAETGTWAEHGDPSAQRTRNPKPGCPSCEDGRPSKRKASAVKVGEYHNVAANQAISNSDQQFPDLCFEQFCQGCDLDTASSEGNGLANNFLNFGLQSSQPSTAFSLAPSAPGMNMFDNHLTSPLYGFNDTTWLLPQSHYSDAFQSVGPKNPKVDFDISAARLEPKPELTGSATDAQSCVCRWQHAPGLLCLAAFPDASALHAHIKATHVDNCAQCVCQWENCEASSKDFKQRSKLSRHLLAHAGHRPYACSFKDCNKTFATNQAKDNHERTHTGERPYVCDRCGYTTTTHTQLQTHISALHEGKKPHKCRFCDFSCADSSNLSKHERTHQVSPLNGVHSIIKLTQ
ncbi:zinc-finger protein [Didymosphaeria variabile]|uniref:Zinc-finger protein n=1 Tax=Didymosphaeria variabile TaxID=1932322 RepID=A0A9W8XMW3_9PLEO|nr:zinc-finger protein [Didymosphaeria variabile]KAJ4354484.1 zinc-finger protein [Didymosphaeria variabile]